MWGLVLVPRSWLDLGVTVAGQGGPGLSLPWAPRCPQARLIHTGATEPQLNLGLRLAAGGECGAGVGGPWLQESGRSIQEAEEAHLMGGQP